MSQSKSNTFERASSNANSILRKEINIINID